MAKGLITARYLGVRIMLALVFILGAAVTAHQVALVIYDDIARKASIAQKLDRVQLLVSEITGNLYGISIAEDDTRAYNYRIDNNRLMNRLEDALAGLEGHVDSDWYGAETIKLIQNPTIDPYGQIHDFIIIIEPLTKIEGDWGEAAQPRIAIALDLSRLILPLIHRLQEAERIGVMVAVAQARRWGDIALGLSTLFIALAAVVIFLPLARRVLISQTEIEAERSRAEAASAAKSDFLATMSHEIRTPMNGVLGMAELLRVGDLPDRERKMVEVIKNSGSTLLRLLNDILDFSKMEAGKFQLDHEPFSPRSICEDAVALFSGQATNKGLGIGFETDGPLHPAYFGDPARLRQIVTNMLGNAIKFTDEGQVAVMLRAGPLDDGRQTISIEVSDTGRGLSAEELERIFDAFEQGQSSVGQGSGGTGLGLAICKHLATLMGGDIDVTSEPGKGSTFAIRLPLEADVTQQEDSDETGDLRLGFFAIPDGDVAQELMGAFRTAGMAIRRFDTFQQATAAAQTERPSFILIALPDGAEPPDVKGGWPAHARHSGEERIRMIAYSRADVADLRHAGFDHWVHPQIPAYAAALHVASRLSGVEDLPPAATARAPDTRKVS